MRKNDVTGDALRRMRRELDSLSFVHCNHLRSECVAALLLGAAGLSFIEINGCVRITDDQILRALMENEVLGETMRRMRFHNCNFAPVADEEEDIDLAEGEPRGRWVELPWVLAPASLLRIYCNLTVLHLTFCGWVTDSLVEDIGLESKCLEDLDLTGCTNIRREDGLDPLMGLQCLRTLGVSDMHEEVSFYFLQEMTTLRRVECRDNPQVNDEDVCGLLVSSPQLEHLSLEGCSGVGRPVVNCACRLLENPHKGRLDIFLGGTTAKRQRRDRLNNRLGLRYERSTTPLFPE